MMEGLGAGAWRNAVANGRIVQEKPRTKRLEGRVGKAGRRSETAQAHNSSTSFRVWGNSLPFQTHPRRRDGAFPVFNWQAPSSGRLGATLTTSPLKPRRRNPAKLSNMRDSIWPRCGRPGSAPDTGRILRPRNCLESHGEKRDNRLVFEVGCHRDVKLFHSACIHLATALARETSALSLKVALRPGAAQAGGRRRRWLAAGGRRLASRRRSTGWVVDAGWLPR